MLTGYRQRVLFLLLLAAGAMILLPLRGPLTPADASSGLSLLMGRGGLFVSLPLVAVAGCVTLVAAALANARVAPVSGLFIVSGALTLLAAMGAAGGNSGGGGSIDGLMRTAHWPNAYLTLTVELLLWAGLWVAAIVGLHRAPARWRATPPQTDALSLRLPRGSEWLATLVTAGVGGAVCWWLLRSADNGQVIGSLLAGFALGGIAGRLVAPHAPVTAWLPAPLIVGLVAYGLGRFQFASHEAVLRAFFNLSSQHGGAPRLPGIALALPLHYAGAGVLGALLGQRWGTGLIEREEHEAA